MIRDGLPLLLVHGVGHHKPVAIQPIVSDMLAKLGVQHVSPYEFNWDGLFRKTSQSNRSLDIADMTALGRAFWAASWIGVEDGLASQWNLRAIRAGWSVFTAVVALWILVLAGWLLAYGASRFTSPVPPIRVGLPWSSYWFPPLPPDLLAQTLPAAGIALSVVSQFCRNTGAEEAQILWIISQTPAERHI